MEKRSIEMRSLKIFYLQVMNENRGSKSQVRSRFEEGSLISFPPTFQIQFDLNGSGTKSKRFEVLIHKAREPLKLCPRSPTSLPTKFFFPKMKFLKSKAGSKSWRIQEIFLHKADLLSRKHCRKGNS